MSHVLMPEDPLASVVSGFVEVNGTEYAVRICGISVSSEEGRKQKPFHSAQFQCDAALARLFPDTRTIKSRLRLADSVDNFLTELVDLIQSKTPKNRDDKTSIARSTFRSLGVEGKSIQAQLGLPDTAFYQVLIHEIDQIGWGQLVDVNEMMTRVAFQFKDDRGRQHVMGFEIPADYPKTAPLVRHVLPVKFDASWNNQAGDSLKTLVARFRLVLKQLDTFWDDLAEIDSACWVQEPEHISTAHRHRRVVIAKHCSIMLEVIDPLNPRCLPKTQFLGAAALVSEHQMTFATNVGLWNPEVSLLKNLQTTLALELPSRAKTNPTDYILNCGICYSYRLYPKPSQNTSPAKSGPIKRSRISSGTDANRTKKINLDKTTVGDDFRENSDRQKNKELNSDKKSNGGKRKEVSASTLAAAALFDRREVISPDGSSLLSTPDQICDNKNCGKSFHYACLLEWMRSTPATRKSFGSLFGSCPYCSSPISIDTLKAP